MSDVTIKITPAYGVEKINDFQSVKASLPCLEHGDWSENWLFLGTSGTHGSYLDLPEVNVGEKITVLIVRPRVVFSLYGSILIESEQQKIWLSRAVDKTVKAIEETQRINTDYFFQKEGEAR